jgi:hypothetical protein
MRGDLVGVTVARFGCGILGGVVLPAFVGFGGADGGVGGDGRGLAIASFALVLAGELCERWLFFAAATAPKMPGGPA